jgi:hypothetical protein
MRKIRIGAGSEGVYELTEFAGDALPFEIGSLERTALTYLGDWQTVKYREQPFGFYYRLGIKEGVIDADGDPATVLLHFAAPFAKEGHAITPQMQATLEQNLVMLIRTSTVAVSQIVDNAVGVRVSPPDYMLRELVAGLSD